MSLAAEEIGVPADEARTLFDYSLILGDTALILGQRVCAWTSHAPTVELDIALANQSLDLIGQARMLLDYAGQVEGKGRGEDQIAFLRDAHEFRNLLMVELPNGDFAHTMARQLMYGAFATGLYGALAGSSDQQLSGIAQKAVKEVGYHARHAGEWMVRLGDGTDESHRRAQQGLDAMWPYAHEFFTPNETEREALELGFGVDVAALEGLWLEQMGEVAGRAGLALPEDDWAPSGGKDGVHTEHLGYILAEMQFLQRTYPGAEW